MIRGHAEIVENRSEYDRLLATLEEMKGAYVKVGFPEGAPVGSQETKRVTVKSGKQRVGSYSKAKGSGRAAYTDMSEVIAIAIWNEFGVPKKGGAGPDIKKWNKGFWQIPPRPFFRNAIDGHKTEIINFVERLSIDVQLDRRSVDEALEMIGIFVQDLIKKSITELTTPANAPATIAMKGSSHPLIDTGQMRNSVTFTKIKG